MRILFFLIIFFTIGIQVAMALSEEATLGVGQLTELEGAITVWDVLKPGAIEETYSAPLEYYDFYEQETKKETIFHINDTERVTMGNGYRDMLYDLYPVIKLDFYFIFNEEQTGGLGYLGSFSHIGLMRNKSTIGIKIRTTVGYGSYH